MMQYISKYIPASSASTSSIVVLTASESQLIVITSYSFENDQGFYAPEDWRALSIKSSGVEQVIVYSVVVPASGKYGNYNRSFPLTKYGKLANVDIDPFIRTDKLVLESGDSLIMGRYSNGLLLQYIVFDSSSYHLPTVKSFWNSAALYKKGQIVYSNGVRYIARTSSGNLNQSPSTATNYWQRLTQPDMAISLSSVGELKLNNLTLIGDSAALLEIRSTLTNKSFVSAKISSVPIGNFTLSLPTLTTDSTVLLINNTQTISGGIFTSPVLSTATVTTDIAFNNFSVAAISVISPQNPVFSGNSLTLTTGMRNVVRVTAPAGDGITLTINLPSTASLGPFIFSLYLTTAGVGQQISVPNCKFATYPDSSDNPRLSTTSGVTDKFTFISDGSYWFGIPSERGMA